MSIYLPSISFLSGFQATILSANLTYPKRITCPGILLLTEMTEVSN